MVFSKPTELSTPGVNYPVKCTFRVIMMGQCRFTDCDQCITLERDADGGRGCAHEEAGGMELSGF